MDKIKDCWRLGHHLMPPTGWLNDPNGLCWFQGNYHVFFQYSPEDVMGGLKVWGHYRSADLVNWEFTGEAMTPEIPEEEHGVYSGSALTEHNRMHLFYTGNVKKQGDYNYVTDGRENNTLYAYSDDGIHFSEHRCLLRQEDYPTYMTCHVRDPKVWSAWKNGELVYYMILGGRTIEEKGVILLYQSADKTDWTFVNEITTGAPLGYMWECPDAFQVEEQKVLSISPQGIEAEGFLYQNKYQSGYFTYTGELDRRYRLGEFREWDRGFDFYAPQTFADDQGRRILIGWMGMPDVPEFNNPTIEYGWQHALTIPREIKSCQGVILQQPVDEMKHLRAECIDIVRAEERYGSYETEVKNEEGEAFCITIANYLHFGYDPEQRVCTLLFEGEGGDRLGGGRTSRAVYVESCKKIRIFVDHSAVEIFINDGEEVFTTRFYPENGKSNIVVSGDIKIEGAWRLQRMGMKGVL